MLSLHNNFEAAPGLPFSYFGTGMGNKEMCNSDELKGFSLLELMAVITLIALLVTITITRIADSSDAAKEKTCFHNRMELNSALERYAVTNGSFATAMSDLDTADYFPGGIPTCEVTGSAYALNTTTHRVEGHTTSGANPGDH